MKWHVITIFVLLILMISCTAIATPVAVSPGFQLPTDIPITTQSPALAVNTQATEPPSPQPTSSTGSFELIGHTSLLNRGMNAGLAVYRNYAYVGSRTDGSHADAGVLVIETSNPANPQVVYQIGPPEEGNLGQTSRELRVWPDQELLLILNFACEEGLHDCGQSSEPPNISFYDIAGANAAAPKLILKFVLSRLPHEFFLWEDPKVAGRALLYVSRPGIVGDNLLVL